VRIYSDKLTDTLFAARRNDRARRLFARKRSRNRIHESDMVNSVTKMLVCKTPNVEMTRLLISFIPT
jgi:hypothetical protein